MSRSWPAFLLFGVLLFARGCSQAEQGADRLAKHPYRVPAGDGDLAARSENLAHAGERQQAQTEIDAGRYVQVGGGLVAAAGVVLLVLGLVSPKSQPSAAKPAAPPAETAPAPPADPNAQLTRIKLIVEVLTSIVGLIGAVLALFGLSHR